MEILRNILIVSALAFLSHRYIFTTIRVEGLSMYPTLKSKQLLLVLKFTTIDLGDIIVFQLPNEKPFIKRVTAIENNEYYVLGDNTNNSKDSRHYGLIHKDDVIGKVWTPMGK